MKKRAKNSMNDVSVIIITKDARANFNSLKNCVDSLKRQNFKSEYEIIIIDSGKDIINIPDVTLIKEPRLGFGIARNTGIKHAKYDLIAFIDDDCVADDNWLSELMNSFNNENVAGIGGSTLHTNTNIIGEAVSYIGWPGGGIKRYILSNKKVGKTNAVSTCNCMFRKKTLVDVGLFNEKLRFGREDSELCARLIKKYDLLYSPLAIVKHKQRDSFYSIFKWWFRRGRAENGKFVNYLIFIILSLFTLILFPKLTSLIPNLLIFAFVLYFTRKFTNYYRITNKLRVLSVIPFVLIIMKLGFIFGGIWQLFKNSIS